MERLNRLSWPKYSRGAATVKIKLKLLEVLE